MKNLKLISLLMLVITVMLFAFTSCEVVENITDKIPGIGGNDEHVHNFVEGKCDCGEEDPNYVAPHEHSYEAVVTEPTCTEVGYTTYTCACGDSYTADEVASKGHDYEGVVTEPTCTADGYTTYTCTVCGDSNVVTDAPATGHSYETVVTEPTCTEGGYTTYTCACGDTYTADEVEAKGHSYQTVVTEPTCTEGGYTTYTCACGDSYVGDEVEAKGHSYESVVTAPTCTTDGYTTYTCACGDSYVGDEVKAGHKYDANGVCSGCNGELLTVVPEVGKGYIFGMLQGKLNKVYYLKGGMNGYYMATTTDPSQAIFVYIEETEGGYYMYCYENGTKTYINMVVSGTHVNGAYEAKASTVYTIDAEHHTLIAKVDGAEYWFATRNDNTYTTMGPCKVSYNGFYGEFYDAHIHNYEKGETVAPTCEDDGYTPYTCSCGASEKRDVVSALGHSFGEWTDLQPGEDDIVCEWVPTQIHYCNCGASETQVTGEATGHKFTEGVCDACGAKDPDYVAPDTPVVPEGGEADLDAIVLPSNKPNGDSSYTGSYTSPNGWVINYSAIQCGGSTVLNPQFPVIGSDNTHKAVCLNGKVSAPGKVTSPVLTTGISKLTINYTKMFTDTELSVTVTITDAAGNKYTHVIAQTLPKDENYVVYTDVWTLETPVVGEFTIEIVNNCPTGATGNKDRFTILDIIWDGAAEAHTHEYTSTTTATCTAAGVTTYTCECGDTYTEETEKLGHVDANLDIDCDVDGCTGKVAPAADSLLSNFTANNLGSKLSTSVNYYIVGTVAEVLDARNGIFLLDDGTGELFYIRLPKNADGVAHSSWEIKLVLGDKIQIYGKIAKFTSNDAPNGSYWPSMQSGVVTVLEQHPHDYTNTPATCFFPAYCVCGANNNAPLGHTDADGDKVCDACKFSTSTKMETVITHYDDIKGTENVTANDYTFAGVNFSMIVEKGGSTLNTNSTNYIRVQNLNNAIVKSHNGQKIVSITFVATSSSYVDELQLFLESAGYTHTTNDLQVTISVDSLESVTLANSSKKVARIAHIIVIYDDAPAHGHSYESVVTAPTCTEAGFTTYTCACGDTYTDNQVDALGHTYVEGKCTCGAEDPNYVAPEAPAEALSNAVLDCTTKDNRVSFSTEEQIWEQNGIKLTLKRGEGSAYGDKAPITFGSKGSLTLEGKGMKTLVIETGNTTYGTYVKNCFVDQEGVASVSSSSGTVTVVLTEATDVFTIATLAKQGQIKSITVNPAE